VASRPWSGLRRTRRPSRRRPIGASRAARVEYTSNGSAVANQPAPNNSPPSRVTAAYTARASPTIGTLARSGSTSSSQTKPASASAAGQ
jgi:hypothetical protein